MKQKALVYLSKGLSVIPVGKDKKPLIAWQEFQTRRATEKEVEEWFKNPEAQIGIVTGKISNLAVVDIEEGGSCAGLPMTLIAKTGGNGWHYYYRYHEGVRNKARINGELIDIRGEGGYVIAPPSVSYKGKYEWTVTEEIAQFPLDKFEIKQEKEHIPDEFPGYGKGERNDKTARYIGKILNKVHPSDWETIAWATIQQANQRNHPPLEPDELRRTFESIKNSDKRNNGDRWKKPETKEEPKEEVEIEHIATVADKQAINALDKFSTGYNIFDEALKRRNEGVGGLNYGDLVIVTGPTGNGKTLFSMCLQKNLTDQGLPALWFSYEVLVADLWEDMKDIGVDESTTVFCPLKNTTGQLDWVKKMIQKGVNQYSTKVIVIDHLGFLTPSQKGMANLSSNYSAYLGQICRELKSIAIENEVIIILPVHMRKTDKPTINDIRDSSGIAQESDVVFTIYREKAEDEAEDEYTDYSKITVGKNRKGSKHPRGWFSKIDGILCHDSFYNPNKQRYDKTLSQV